MQSRDVPLEVEMKFVWKDGDGNYIKEDLNQAFKLKIKDD
jgi:hypothetical protein